MAETYTDRIMDDLRAAYSRIDALEAALKRIAAPTYGTEPCNTPEEVAEIYWTTISTLQHVARAALAAEPVT